MFGPKSSNIGLQRLLAMRKARVWRAFLIQRRKFPETRTAWLGAGGYELRMGESKSAGTFNDFNPRSEYSTDFIFICFNRLGGI